MARRIKERKLKSRNITIIGEGLTERGYFKHLKSLKGYRYTCKPRNFSQQSIDDLQKQIGKVLEDDGVAVCVFDANVARDKPAERKKLEAMQKKYAGKEQVILCDNMPSIEFWFLIHYLNTNKYFASSTDVIKVLHRFLPDFSKHETITTAVNACGYGIWDLCPANGGFRLELSTHIEEEDISNLCYQLPLMADYEGEGRNGSMFSLQLS